MSPDIFLSYASEDRNLARVFVDALQKQGFSVWWDRAIQPGTSFEREIDQVIAASRCVIVLWSSASILSNWVSNEALEGLERGILVPVLIEKVRIPIAFRGIQASLLDEFPARAEPEELEKFYAAIKGILDKQEQSVAPEIDRNLDSRVLSSPNKNSSRSAKGSLAILPFENLTNIDDNDYLCDGLADELRVQLARLPDLKVASNSASVHAARESEDVRIVGQVLEVERVIEGRLRRFGKSFRLTVEMTTVHDGYQAWAHSMSVNEDTLPQDSEDLITTARAVFDTSAETNLSSNYQPQPEAYQEFLRGKFFFNSADTKSRQKAITHFERSVELDDRFAGAYCGLANAYLLRHIGSNDPNPPKETFSQAKAAGLRAYELDPEDAATIGVMGSLYFNDWQWDKARLYLTRSLALDPTDTMIRHSYASVLCYEGKLKEATEFMEETLQFDPLSPIAVNGTARLLRYSGRFLDATDVCERLLEAMPNSLAAIEEMAENAFSAQDYDKARNILERERQHLGGDHPTIIWHQARIAIGTGDNDGFYKHFNHLKLIARTTYVTSAIVAICYLFAGKIERALDFLEIGVDEKDPWLVDLDQIPLPRVLTNTERYQAVLNAVRSSPSQLP